MGIRLKPPNRAPPPVILRVRLAGLVGEKLATYRDMYRESYGEEIRLEVLAAEIIGQFLDKEPALRRKRRERRLGEGHDQDDAAAGGRKKAEEP